MTVATWTPQDAVVNPLLATLGYYRRARQLGAVFYTGVEVTALGTRRGRIREVIAADGTVYEADAVILRPVISAGRSTIPWGWMCRCSSG